LCCIDFCDDKSFDVLKFEGKLVVFRSKCFTVATPRSVKLKKDIILTVSYELIEVLSNNNLNWLIIGSWDLIRFKELG